MLMEGTCSAEYLGDLRALCNTMQVASKCGLGQTSSVAFCSIIEDFGGEIMGHAKRPR
jgi:[NiFe] hydrogenase diaphorase moiety large subunit